MSKKILIADDEQHILDTVGAYLKNEGYDILTVRDVRAALFTFRHEQPDLVILDVMMPEMNGWEAARMIRQERHIPLLFLTCWLKARTKSGGWVWRSTICWRV